MTVYYIDTCIWRDFAEDRTDGSRPLGEWARAFLKKAFADRHPLVWSVVVEQELTSVPHRSYILKVRREFEVAGLIVTVSHTYEQLREAAILSRDLRVPLDDALHAVLARDADAVLVTRDTHFQRLRAAVLSAAPEELL